MRLLKAILWGFVCLICPQLGLKEIEDWHCEVAPYNGSPDTDDIEILGLSDAANFHEECGDR